MGCHVCLCHKTEVSASTASAAAAVAAAAAAAASAAENMQEVGPESADICGGCSCGVLWHHTLLLG